MDVRTKNRGRSHQKVRLPVAPVMGRNFLTSVHPVSAENSDPKVYVYVVFSSLLSFESTDSTERLAEFCAELGEFCEKLGQFAVGHMKGTLWVFPARCGTW